MDRTLTRFALTSFESLDVEGPDGAAAARLKDALGQEIAARMDVMAGWAGVDEVVAALATQGHRFELRKSTEEWHSYFQETNGGTREFWIHASREADLVMVMVLYHEKLEVTAARRLERLGPGERVDAETTDAFYDEGLVLVRRDEAGERLTDDERLHLVLLSLESGVANGGFATYLSNTDGRQLAEAVRGLATVGATDLEQVTRAVARLVTPGLEGEALQEALDRHAVALGELDERFGSSTDNLALLVMAYRRGIRQAPRRRGSRKGKGS
jgi:hypothetical protein